MQQILSIAGSNYVLDKDRLRVIQYEDVLLDVCLSPVLDNKRIEIDKWEEIEQNHFQASLGKYGQAFICEKLGTLAYWIETPVKQFENVTYLSDGIISLWSCRR